LALWKIIKGGCRLDPQKIEARTFPADICTQNFFFGGGGGVSRYAAFPLIVALSPAPLPAREIETPLIFGTLI